MTRWLVGLAGLGLIACSSTDEPPAVMGEAGATATAGTGGAVDAGGAGGGGVGGGGSAGMSNGGAAGASAGAGGGGAAGEANGGAAGQGGAAGSGGSPTLSELRVTSSNIRYGTADDGVNAWPMRKDLLFRVLKAQTFDSAGLQEALAAQLMDLDAALPEYGRVGVGRDDGKEKGEYSAILYLKERYEVASSGTFWLSDTPEVPGSKSFGNTLPRICTWARLLHKPSGRHYYHYNAHLDHQSQPAREKGVQLIAARMKARPEQDEPVVLTGDFNATPDNLAVTYLLGSKTIDDQQTPITLVDAWLELHDVAIDGGTTHSFKGGTSGGHIDYVMSGPGIAAKSAEIVRTHEGDVYPSDHYPVSAVFTLAP